jgi:hypothetical protein
MHHRLHVPALDEFFDACGHRADWERRQAAMLSQCRYLVDLCRRWNVGAVRLWEQRTAVTAGWVE